MPNRWTRGIVEVMEHSRHEERAQSLGAALGRLSEQRAGRGSVGVIDPYELARAAGTELDKIVDAELAAAAEQEQLESRPRRGLFSFSDRARDAARRFER